MISAFPISAILLDLYTLERGSEVEVHDNREKFLNYKQEWATVSSFYGRTRSLVGTWPKYRTNPNNVGVFYCEYNDDLTEGDRLTLGSSSIYVSSIADPGSIHHHLEAQCFLMPDTLTFEAYSADTDEIGGETEPTYTPYLTDIVARIDVLSSQEVIEADKLGQGLQYSVTIHYTELIEKTGRLSFVDEAGTTRKLRIKTIKQPDLHSPWLIIEAENWD